MTKILLGTAELNEIIECLKKFPEIQSLEISCEYIAGIGKLTKLIIPIEVNGFEGDFVIPISDHSDW